MKTGPKITGFSSDECQALLDLINKVMDYRLREILTAEETGVYDKLLEAGKFYVPK
jgi:hypothetical protein